jgi:alkylation response protein AidB-like acyl-CoA dehydrogenase
MLFMSTITAELDRNIEIDQSPRAARAWAKRRAIFVALRDGRVVSFPAARFRILSHATDAELAEVTVRVNGFALRWEKIDEDITVPGIVAGQFQLPARN